MITVTGIEAARWHSQCYVVQSGEGGPCVVVDPGDVDSVRIERELQRRQAAGCNYILLTHEHFDHIAGAQKLRQQTGACLVCSRACAAACRDPLLNLSAYLAGQDLTLDAADWICEDRGWVIPWTGKKIEIFSCPGHSPGGVAIRLGNVLFTGDSLLADGPGPTHLPGGNRAQLMQSLEQLSRMCPDVKWAYPGHGEGFAYPGEVKGRNGRRGRT